MRNFIQPGNTMTLTAPTGGVEAGEAVKIGAIFGVAVSDAAEGEQFALEVEGIFELPKVSAQTWAEGDRVYWDGDEATNVATAGQFIGLAAEDKLTSTVLGKVRLVPGAEMSEGPQAAVADVATADADATYGQPEADLINELKDQVNALLAELRTAGIIAP